MNWACLIEAIMTYLQCSQGTSHEKAHHRFTDCLTTAAVAALPIFLKEFLQCISAPDGDGDGPEEGYKPGTRDRCP